MTSSNLLSLILHQFGQVLLTQNFESRVELWFIQLVDLHIFVEVYIEDVVLEATVVDTVHPLESVEQGEWTEPSRLEDGIEQSQNRALKACSLADDVILNQKMKQLGAVGVHGYRAISRVHHFVEFFQVQ